MPIPVRPGYPALIGRRVEVGLGMFTVAFVAVMLVLAGGAGLIQGFGGGDHPVQPNMAIACVGAFALFAAEVAFICAGYVALSRGKLDPFAPLFALRLGRLPAWLRPVLALWWFAHFAATFVVALVAEVMPAAAAEHGVYGRYGWAVAIAAFLAVGFTLAFAFNLYAVLALAAAGATERRVAFAWRYRIVLDVFVALVAAGGAGHVAREWDPSVDPSKPIIRRPPPATRHAPPPPRPPAAGGGLRP